MLSRCPVLPLPRIPRNCPTRFNIGVTYLQSSLCNPEESPGWTGLPKRRHPGSQPGAQSDYAKRQHPSWPQFSVNCPETFGVLPPIPRNPRDGPGCLNNGIFDTADETQATLVFLVSGGSGKKTKHPGCQSGVTKRTHPSWPQISVICPETFGVLHPEDSPGWALNRVLLAVGWCWGRRDT